MLTLVSYMGLGQNLNCTECSSWSNSWNILGSSYNINNSLLIGLRGNLKWNGLDGTIEGDNIMIIYSYLPLLITSKTKLTLSFPKSGEPRIFTGLGSGNTWAGATVQVKQMSWMWKCRVSIDGTSDFSKRSQGSELYIKHSDVLNVVKLSFPEPNNICLWIKNPAILAPRMLSLIYNRKLFSVLFWGWILSSLTEIRLWRLELAQIPSVCFSLILTLNGLCSRVGGECYEGLKTLLNPSDRGSCGSLGGKRSPSWLSGVLENL